MFRVVVLISGGGSNFLKIVSYFRTHELPVACVGLISNRPESKGLKIAKEFQIPPFVLDHTTFVSRTTFEQALAHVIDSLSPDLIVLAGFMRVLSKEFTELYLGKMINIHPSLLPKFKGLHTHRRALAAKEVEHGASVHFVSPELDGGPLIAQAKLQVDPKWNAEVLGDQVLRVEHLLYPLVIRAFSEHRISWNNGCPTFDGKPLSFPIQLEELLNEYYTD